MIALHNTRIVINRRCWCIGVCCLVFRVSAVCLHTSTVTSRPRLHSFCFCHFCLKNSVIKKEKEERKRKEREKNY